MTRRISRVAYAMLITGMIAACLALVLLSPLGLRSISSFPGMNWNILGNIGQTYGAVSALLAAIALAGVAISVLLQSREARYSRWEASRNRHADLISLALREPFYLQVFADPGASAEMRKLMAYINLLLQYWSMLWEFRDIPERQLRQDLASILQTEAGQFYWGRAEKTRLAYGSTTKRQREFHRIAHEVYLELQPGASHGTEPSEPSGLTWPHSAHAAQIASALVLAGISGAVIGRILGVRRRSQHGT